MTTHVELTPLPNDATKVLRELPAYWRLLARPGRTKPKEWVARVRSLAILAQTLEGRIEQLHARIARLKDENAALRQEIQVLRKRGVRHYVQHKNERPDMEVPGRLGELEMKAKLDDTEIQARYKYFFEQGNNIRRSRAGGRS